MTNEQLRDELKGYFKDELKEYLDERFDNLAS